MYAEPWRSAALWLPDDTFIPPDGVRYWENPVSWPNWNGKLTLSGDAAHPMMPFRAQGLNNAMADANQYVTSIVAVRDGLKPLGEAITQYGDEVLERGSKEIKLSAAWGPMLHNWNVLINTPMMKQGYGKTQPATKPRSQTTEVSKENDSYTGTLPDAAPSGPLKEKAVAIPLNATNDATVPHATLRRATETTTSLLTSPAALQEPSRLTNGDPPTPSLTPTEDKNLTIPSFTSPNTTLSPVIALERVQEAVDALKAMQLENETLRKRNQFLEHKLRTITELCTDM